MNGIIVIDKEKGFTSHDAVAVVKGLTGEKHLGHTGTLDPNATGVLPIALGSCTRLIEYMDTAKKEYVALAKLGIATDTMDIWGSVLEEREYSGLSREKLLEVISHYVGDIVQIPPKYSAVKVNGRRLYSYARNGEEVQIPERKVKVYGIELLSFEEAEGEFEIKISCGRGTYIRSIISDIGDELGFGACMTALRRTSACGFSESEAVTVTRLRELPKEEILNYVRPAENAVAHMKRVRIDEARKADFAHGKKVTADTGEMPLEEPVCVFFEDELCGIAEWDGPDILRPVKVFVR